MHGGWKIGQKRCHCRIGLFPRFGGCSNMILHALPNQGGGVLCWWQCTLAEAEAEAKRIVGENYEEVK